MAIRNPAGYTIMYHGWFDADISDAARLTILAIYSFFNQQTRDWFETPTVERVSILRNLSERTVKDHFTELESAGLIRRERTPIAGGGSVLTIEIVEPKRSNPAHKDTIYEGAENCTLGRGSSSHPQKVQKIAPSFSNNTNGIITEDNNKQKTNSISGSTAPDFLAPIESTEPKPDSRFMHNYDREIKSPEFPFELRQRMQSSLGPDYFGVIHGINQNMIDSGFVSYAVERDRKSVV